VPKMGHMTYFCTRSYLLSCDDCNCITTFSGIKFFIAINCLTCFVSDVAVFVLKRDVKLQLTN